MGRKSKYDPSMLAKIESLMSEGAGINEIAPEIGLSRETIYKWCNTDSDIYNKEFADMIEHGKELCLAWWERQGRINLENKEFNSTLWYMNMKNRHGWRDKQDVELSGGSFQLVIKK